MFAGIVTAVGRILAMRTEDGAMALTIESPYPDLTLGESVAVSGACLTVVAVNGSQFTAQVMAPTRQRTRLGQLEVGSRVNLERALAVGDRLGGHFVQGHVDGLGRVSLVQEGPDALVVNLAVPPEVADVTPLHGSIAVDGVSLTVNAIPEAGQVQVALIPHTRAHTTLGNLRVGDTVHVEADLMGKLVRQLLQPWRISERKER
ncbi:MAG TPA: riboflavin synthase [Gemmatimonadales bacterium]|nr:riboflavin synthase [Gemmatimonadales bacterium]